MTFTSLNPDVHLAHILHDLAPQGGQTFINGIQYDVSFDDAYRVDNIHMDIWLKARLDPTYMWRLFHLTQLPSMGRRELDVVQIPDGPVSLKSTYLVPFDESRKNYPIGMVEPVNNEYFTAQIARIEAARANAELTRARARAHTKTYGTIGAIRHRTRAGKKTSTVSTSSRKSSKSRKSTKSSKKTTDAGQMRYVTILDRRTAPGRVNRESKVSQHVYRTADPWLPIVKHEED